MQKPQGVLILGPSSQATPGMELVEQWGRSSDKLILSSAWLGMAVLITIWTLSWNAGGKLTL